MIKRFTILIPFLLLCAVLLPFALLLLPLLLIACLFLRVSPVRTMKVTWGLLLGTRGTEVEVARHQRQLSVRIS